MGWKTAAASLDLALDSPSKEIRLLFIGGEPLLEWRLIRRAVERMLVNLPPGKRIRFEISTNGLLISDEVAQFLDEHRFEVQLSFDGVPEAQDYRCKGTFATLDRILNRLREKQPDLFRERLRIVVTLIPATIQFLGESIRYLTGKGIREIGISASLTPSAGWDKERIQTLEHHFKEIFDDAMRHFKRTEEVPLTLFRKWQNDSSVFDELRRCSAATGKTLAVDADGQVYGCAMFAESYQEFPSELLRSQLRPLKMGNVRDRSFRVRHAAYREAMAKATIFNGREKRYSSYGKCIDCPYLGSCWVCPVSIGYDPGNTDPHRVPDFICAFNRVALKYRYIFPCMPNPVDKLNAVFERIIS